MRLSLTATGLINSTAIDAWSARAQRTIWSNVRGGMESGGRSIAARARAQAASALKGRRAAASIRHKVYAENRQRLPALQIYSKVPWLNVHETGRTIGGKMLIPFGDKRMRRGAFLALVKRLFREKRAYFVRGKRSTVLMAKRAGRGDGVSRFTGPYRQRLKSRGESGRIKRGADIPIAIAVNRVTIKRRLRIGEIVRTGLPSIAGAIRGQ